MKAVQDRQKSFEDKRRRNLDSRVGDLILGKFSPIQGALRLGKTGKVSSEVFLIFSVFL